MFLSFHRILNSFFFTYLQGVFYILWKSFIHKTSHTRIRTILECNHSSIAYFSYLHRPAYYFIIYFSFKHVTFKKELKKTTPKVSYRWCPVLKKYLHNAYKNGYNKDERYSNDPKMEHWESVSGSPCYNIKSRSISITKNKVSYTYYENHLITGIHSN